MKEKMNCWEKFSILESWLMWVCQEKCVSFIKLLLEKEPTNLKFFEKFCGRIQNFISVFGIIQYI